MSGTRAVRRLVASGENSFCEHCGNWIKYQARRRLWRIICNVYEGDRWDRVEIYHETCWIDVGEPHGPIIDSRDR